jgi:hypothetical protein
VTLGLDLIERDSTILFDPSVEAAAERKAERPVSWPTRDVHEAGVSLRWLGQRGEIGIQTTAEPDESVDQPRTFRDPDGLRATDQA